MKKQDKVTGRFAMVPLKERFFEKIEVNKKTGCHEWVGSKNRGYGKMRDELKTSRPATHIAWLIKYGKLPTLLMCHKCDNPSCVNVEHLFEGTYADNAKDMINKGRKPRGEDSGGTKLNIEQVREIRKLKEKGELNYSKYARECGLDITYHAIRLIALGKNWKYAK